MANKSSTKKTTSSTSSKTKSSSVKNTKSDKEVLKNEVKVVEENSISEDLEVIEKNDESKEIVEEKQPKEINPDDVLLEVSHLRKQYNKKAKPAIDDLNFKVLRGQFHAFIGANGAGKTTTIKSIVGAYANFEGSVKICGISNKEKESKLKLGYIPEIARFPANISTFNYLKTMAMLNKLSKKEAEEFTKNILIEFKMYNLKNVCPNKFSSGQKKKILLAQSLSNNPDILIMDEPAANLDPRARIDFFKTLKELQKKHNKSIFISSHILSELDLYADSLTILDGGKIVYTGIKEEAEKQENNDLFKYRVTLTDEGYFDKNKIDSKMFTLEQDEEDKCLFIITSKSEEALNNLIGNLFKQNKISKIESYKLTIEDLYKKYVILGSVHTGYKQNANYELESESKSSPE